MKSNNVLDVWPPIRLVTMGVICITGLIFLPNAWWAIIIKVFLGLFLVGIVKGSFDRQWEEYETMGAFVTMQLVAFTTSVLFYDAPAVTFIAILIITIGWITMSSRVKGKVRLRDKE